MLSKRLFNISIAVVLLIGVAITVREAVATTSVINNNVVVGETERMLRVREADAGRLNAQAEKYSDTQFAAAERMQRVYTAYSARLNAQAKDFSELRAAEAGRIQRVRDAETTRWNALARHYLKK